MNEIEVMLGFKVLIFKKILHMGKSVFRNGKTTKKFNSNK